MTLDRLNFSNVLLLFATMACGSKAVDLDGAQPDIAASPDPSVLGTIRESVVQLAGDQERLYWLENPDPDREVGPARSLRSCSKSSCATSLFTFTEMQQPLLPFGLVAGDVYWFEQPQRALELHGQASDGSGVARLIPSPDSALMVAYGQDTAYLVHTEQGATDNGELEAIPLPDGDGTESTTPFSAASLSVLTMVVAGDYLYWLESEQDGSYRVMRVRVDGSSEARILAENLDITLDLGGWPEEYRPNGNTMAVDNSYAYWVDNALRGTIRRCPVAGCAGDPEIVLSPVRKPKAVLLDGGTLYFSYELDAFVYAIAKCDPNQCQPTLLAQNVDNPGALVTDDEWLYFASTSQYVGPDPNAEDQGTLPSPVTQIRKVAK